MDGKGVSLAVVVLAGFLVIIALLNPFYPIQSTPPHEMQVVAGTQPVPVTIRRDMKPRSEFTDAHIIKQQFDYSCGSAALATLLNFYLGEKLNERQVISGLLEYGDRKQIEKLRAFSLLDMKRFVEKLGYKGAGYKADLADLAGMDKPCIVPLEIFGYQHFVVFRGIVEDHVFVADPYLGNISLPMKKFKKMWYRNVAFIVTDGEVLDSPLMLREDDLRFVTLDMTRRALDAAYQPPSIILDEIRLERAAGLKGNYR